MESCVGVDLHLRTATICHLLDGREQSLRTVPLHSTEWHKFWGSMPGGADVFVEMSRTTSSSRSASGNWSGPWAARTCRSRS